MAGMEGEHVDVLEAVRTRLLMWTDADTLALLILQLRHTHDLHADVVCTVLSLVRCISLADALRMTGARLFVHACTFRTHEVFPSPHSTCTNFFYLSQAAEADAQLTINARSHWRGTDGRDLCYKVSVALADVSMCLAADGQSLQMSVARVHLVTNALSHDELTEDFLREISRLRLSAAFDANGDTLHVFDASSPYGFGVLIRYKASDEQE